MFVDIALGGLQMALLTLSFGLYAADSLKVSRSLILWVPLTLVTVIVVFSLKDSTRQEVVYFWFAVLACVGFTYLVMPVLADIQTRKENGNPRLMWTWTKSYYIIDPLTVALYRRRMRRDPLSSGSLRHRMDGDRIWESVFHGRGG